MVKPIVFNGTIANTGGVLALDITRAESLLILDGSGVLAGNYTVQSSANPDVNTMITVLYRASMTTGAFGISFFGYTMLAEEALNSSTTTFIFNGTNWEAYVSPNFNNRNVNFLNGGVLQDGTVAASVFANNAISNAKLALATIGSIKSTDIHGNVVDLVPTAGGQIPITAGIGALTTLKTLGGDGILDSAGNLTIGNNKIGNAKLANMALGTVKVGGAGNVATDLPVSSGQILVGTTSGGVQAVDLDGAININESGDAILQPSVVFAGNTTLDMNLTTGLMSGIKSCLIMSGSSLKALLSGATQSVGIINAGALILSARLIEQTASGVGGSTISVGVDANLNGTAITNGFLNVLDANTAGFYSSADSAGYSSYVGSIAKKGMLQTQNQGSVTITSSIDLRSSAFAGVLIIEFINQ